MVLQCTAVQCILLSRSLLLRTVDAFKHSTDGVSTLPKTTPPPWDKSGPFLRDIVNRNDGNPHKKNIVDQRDTNVLMFSELVMRDLSDRDQAHF